jgi:hypothetical protein
LTTIDAFKVARTMTSTDTLDDSEVDVGIEEALNNALGPAYFAKPKQAAPLLNISGSTFYRGAAAGVIETVPHSDGLAVTRPVLKRLMKYGIPRIPSVVGRKRA